MEGRAAAIARSSERRTETPRARWDTELRYKMSNAALKLVGTPAKTRAERDGQDGAARERGVDVS
jgi:hypothetical protein